MTFEIILDPTMTYQEEEILISRPPLSQQRRSPDRQRLPSRSSSSTPYLRIECQAEERHFIDSSPFQMNSSTKAARFTTDQQIRPGRFRSEIVVQSDPNVDFHIKRLRVAFNDPSDFSSITNHSKASRSHSVNNSGSRQTTTEQSGKDKQSKRKYRSSSLPRHNSHAILHQWIDDICSNEKLMVNDDIVFFLKNGEFLARI